MFPAIWACRLHLKRTVEDVLQLALTDLEKKVKTANDIVSKASTPALKDGVLGKQADTLIYCILHSTRRGENQMTLGVLETFKESFLLIPVNAPTHRPSP
jgi:hypothetical protein